MSNSNSFRRSQSVEWSRCSGTGRGKVTGRFERDVTRTIRGSEVTRRGSGEDPASLLNEKGGSEDLELGFELSRAG